MESSSDRGSYENDSALLRIQSLGAEDSCPKTTRGRSCACSCVGRNLAQSEAVRLDGGVPQSSANRRVARVSISTRAVSASPGRSLARWCAAEHSRRRCCGENRPSGCKSTIRASLQSYLHCVCNG